jgi:hypothetical protein
MQAQGQELHAPTMDRYVVTGRADVPGTPADESLPGNSSPIMFLGDETTTASDYSAGSISVAGILGDIEATGRVGTITAGRIFGQLQASSFGDIASLASASPAATGTISGQILATGAPGVPTSIRSLFADSDIVSLTVATEQGSIGPITTQARMLNTTVRSAWSLWSVDAAKGLDAVRIQSLRSIDHIRASEMSDTAIQVGVAPTFTGVATKAAQFTAPKSTLGELRITVGMPAGEIAVSGANTLSAPHLGVLRIRNPQSASSLQSYVLDPTSPRVAFYTDANDPDNNFYWSNNPDEPAVLQLSLHHL